MARTGGRNVWIAVPATLLSFAIVVALAWLAVPMVPVAITWAGDALRGVTERAVRDQGRTASPAPDPATLACRGLYPDRLWSQLSWTGGSLLDQGATGPETAATDLVEALAPEVVVTCAWSRSAEGSIVTTLSEVSADAAETAAPALRAQGFACQAVEDAVTCERERGRVREEHTVRGGFWLVSVEDDWWPEDYGALVAAHVFG